jgi:hypothetical protein
MTLTLTLPPETEKKLRESAARAGQSAEGLVLNLIEEALRVKGASPSTVPEKSFDEILAPVREGWEDSGLSDEQVDQVFDDALKKVRAEKRKDVPR